MNALSSLECVNVPSLLKVLEDSGKVISVKDTTQADGFLLIIIIIYYCFPGDLIFLII